MRGRKRAEAGDEGAETGDDAPASSRRRMLAANAREGRAEEDVLQRIAELAPGARDAVLSKLFAEYAGSPGGSPSPGPMIAASAPVSVSERAIEARPWDWRRDASEWELKSLTTALGLPSAGSRSELVAAVEKQLNDLAEPAEQLGVSLSKLHRIMSNSERNATLKLGKGDDVAIASAKVLELCERAKAQATQVLEVDPFQAMQNRDLGPCVLDLAYLYMDFVSFAFDTMMPLLRAEAVGTLEAGTIMTQQLNRCMFLIFKVIGTSTNEGNLYDPRRAGRFLVELGKLRRAWRANCGTIHSLNEHFDEIVDNVDTTEHVAVPQVDSDDPKHIIQLTPYALTELHESYHGPPTHSVGTIAQDESSTTPSSWSAVWQPVSGSTSPATQFARDASTATDLMNMNERDDDLSMAGMSRGGTPRGSDADDGDDVEDAVPLNTALETLDQERRRDNADPSNLANFAMRARRFEMLPNRRAFQETREDPARPGHLVDLNELHGVHTSGVNQGERDVQANQNNAGDRPFMDYMNEGSNVDAMVFTGTARATETVPAANEDPSEARMHAYRLASSTRMQTRLTFTERGQPVRVPAQQVMQQPVSQARMREATSITRLVTALSTRLRSVSSPLLDTGKSKTRSPNTIKFFEHIARWELLGHSNSKEVAKIGLGKMELLCERLAKQSAKDGRWCAVLGRALTIHCMPMQICIMNGLHSEVNGEFPTGCAPASMFCTALTVVIRMVLQSYLEAGQVPKLRAENWWKTLAHLSDVLICWGCGSNAISATFPNNGNPGRHEMSDVVAKGILAGLSMEGSDKSQYNFGKLFMLAAPKLLHDLADADVHATVVDSVSGLCYLFARIMCEEAKTDSRWVEAIELSQATIPIQFRVCLVETAAWAKGVRTTVENAAFACEKYMNKSSFNASDEPIVPGMSFYARSKARRGVRLGMILALSSCISQVSGYRVKSRSSVIIPVDEEGEAAQEAEGGRDTPRTSKRRASRSENVVDLDPVVDALDDCVSALACVATPLVFLGWALDGGHTGIRGGLSLLGNSRWLNDTQGEFPVYSPLQQIVDMTQLLLHSFAELRPPGTSAANAVNALVTDPKWHKTFSMFQAITPNMFYFGSSLDLIGACSEVFPHAFKISRLRKDLKRHAAEFQNASSISLVLDRTSPCPSAWRAINSLCRRALVGRSLNASFEGEDGLGDGVNREAMQILVDTLARGAPGRPGEAVLCSLSFDNQGSSTFLTLRPDAPTAAAIFFGKVIGLIISSNVNVVLPLAPWIWSALLGRKGTLSQLAAVDEEFGRTLMTLHTHPLSHESNSWVSLSGLNFTRTVRLQNGDMVEYDLIPGGRDIAVTDTNRRRFVQSYAWNSMDIVNGESIAAVTEATRKGLCDVIPAELLASLSPVDLERMVCGLPKISLESWKKATIYEPKATSSEDERRIEWFWEAVSNFSPSDQALLLHFWAAYTHLPHSGFDGLHFKIRFDEKLSTDHLPMAQTCFLTLRIPKYVSVEQCSARLLHAVRTGSSGFGFA